VTKAILLAVVVLAQFALLLNFAQLIQLKEYLVATMSPQATFII
jgi:hypothetical protein